MLSKGAVNSPDLRTIAQPERLSETGAVIGIDCRAGPGSADRDIDGGGVDGVGAERFQVSHDPIARGTLGAVNGPHPPRPDMPVGEMGKVEHVAPPVPALDDHAGACGVDRDHLGRLPVQALGPVVVAGELQPRHDLRAQRLA